MQYFHQQENRDYLHTATARRISLHQTLQADCQPGPTALAFKVSSCSRGAYVTLFAFSLPSSLYSLQASIQKAFPCAPNVL